MLCSNIAQHPLKNEQMVDDLLNFYLPLVLENEDICTKVWRKSDNISRIFNQIKLLGGEMNSYESLFTIKHLLSRVLSFNFHRRERNFNKKIFLLLLSLWFAWNNISLHNRLFPSSFVSPVTSLSQKQCKIYYPYLHNAELFENMYCYLTWLIRQWISRI